MKNDVIVGIDTSNYTTSFAIISKYGELIANLKRPLPVKAGERGLRQSEAVFAHIKNIPDIMEEAREYLLDKKIVAHWNFYDEKAFINFTFYPYAYVNS